MVALFLRVHNGRQIHGYLISLSLFLLNGTYDAILFQLVSIKRKLVVYTQVGIIRQNI